MRTPATAEPVVKTDATTNSKRANVASTTAAGAPASPAIDPEAEQYLRTNKKLGLVDTVEQAAWAEKKWIWVESREEGYIQATVIAESGEELNVEYTDGRVATVNINQTEKMNPPKFDKVEDMADLSYLNEASVLHNLKQRYFSSLIYTYSGMFLVTINPYHRLPIYSDKVVHMYKGKKRMETPPHIFSISDQAYHDMQQNRENQSILITGESGAGKTENTKKVIQYLTAIATDSSKSESKTAAGSLEAQILQANPILESFGNAQTIRNNNSSRFGKFIRIEFGGAGNIASANIERYLLEKSRVTHQNAKERNFHIFYQLLKGAPQNIKSTLLLDGLGLGDFTFTKNANKNIDGVDDTADFKSMVESLNVMRFSADDQLDLFRICAAILHLGNLTYVADKEDQASLSEQAQVVAEKCCHILGLPVAEFTKALLKPRMKAGRDWVVQARNPAQVQFSVESLSRALYERMFGKLVDRINQAMDKPLPKSMFIGVLDIAGFEIFDVNSFEQLCINYTNERLQQFFNHNMFILEQEEYKREGIDWKFIDFGLDLQGTIDLIEKSNPIGILSCLDEDCVMPKATDKSFTDKLVQMWKGKSTKFEVPRFGDGFILHHYASQVEYKTASWLDKNKDPLNENVTKLLANSSDKFVAALFVDSLVDEDDQPNNNVQRRVVGTVKKGAFRTVAQKHKEQLNSLMTQLYSTQPHFVRCIIPNEDKKPGKVDANMVLDQLRCNGVLEGIRICRQGFPSRLPFSEFRQRYEIVVPNGVIPKGFMDGRKAVQLLLETLQLDANQFRIGSSKVFFRAGVLAELEEMRDKVLADIVQGFQAYCRGHLGRKKFHKRLDQFKAIRVIQKNARIYVTLREWPWWKLYTKVKPLLNVSRADEELRRREDQIKTLSEVAAADAAEKTRLAQTTRQLEDEKRRVEELLVSEKNAASDQLEILQRTQRRQLDLEDELKALTAEFDKLEQQLDECKQQRDANHQQMSQFEERLREEQLLTEKLEKDKTQKEQQVHSLQAELSASSGNASQLDGVKKALEAQIAALTAKLNASADQQAELQKQKTRLQSTVTELEERVAREEKEKSDVSRKKTSVDSELKQARESLADAQRQRQDLETQMKRRDNEVAQLQQQLATESSEKSALDGQRRDLAIRLETALAEAEQQQLDRDKLVKQRRKLEEELEEMQRLVEERGSTEEEKLQELKRHRESELDDTRRQLESAQQELEQQRKQNANAMDALKSRAEQLQQEKATVERSRLTLDQELRQLREEFDKAEEQRGKAEKAKRQLDGDLQQARGRLAEDEKSAAEYRAYRENSERQIASLTQRLDEAQTAAAKLERERGQAEKQLAAMTDEAEQQQRKAATLDTQRRKLQQDLQELQQRLDEEETQKVELQRQLMAKSAELDQLKLQQRDAGTERVQDLEKIKAKLMTELAELKARSDDVERQLQTADKSKARLQAEAEDWRHQVEQEHAQLRQAEKQSKQLDQELKSTQRQLEAERRQRDQLESAQRRLQSTADQLQQELDERQAALTATQRTKDALEAELRALVDEIGDGGKNVHDLEKQRRRLQSRIDELEALLEESEQARNATDEAKRRVEEQLTAYRQRIEAELLAKDAQMDETRRTLLREVNALGQQLDEEQLAKNDLLKQKKKLEQELQELVSTSDRQNKNKTDQEKARRKADQLVRDLQLKLDDEKKARQNYEDLALRHERKSNQLQTDVEKLEQQLDQAEKSKKQLDRRLEELQVQQRGAEGQDLLQESVKRLQQEVDRLQQELDDESVLKQELETKLASVSSATTQQSAEQQLRAQDERVEKLEEARRALLAQQRVTQQELDERQLELTSLDKQRKLLQSEIADLQQQLEVESAARAEEASGRRKLATDLKDLQMRHDSATQQLQDLQETSATYRAKYDDALTKIEQAELGKLRAEKTESSLKLQLRETEESLAEALKERLEQEQRAKALDMQMTDLHERTEDETQELHDLRLVKEKLQRELADERDRYRQEFDSRDAEIETLRRRIQRELTELTAELEHEKASGQAAKESSHRFQLDIDDLTARLDEETRASSGWQKDKQRLEARVQDLTRAYQESADTHDQLQSQVHSLLTQTRDLRQQLDDAETGRSSLEKQKRSLELRLEEVTEQFTEASQARGTMEKTYSAMESRVKELGVALEEQQDLVAMQTDKTRKAEAAAQEQAADLTRQHHLNSELEKIKSSLEKQVKELNLRVVDLEAAVVVDPAKGSRRLESKLEELASQLDRVSREKEELTFSARKNDRTIRDLTSQLTDKDRLRARQDDDISKLTDKLKLMKKHVDEMEANESSLQMSRRRAEREADEYKDKSFRLEKEVEKLKQRADRLSLAPPVAP